jgi:DNA polymerase III sliding clamp (beta) subunit (PCNA family)
MPEPILKNFDKLLKCCAKADQPRPFLRGVCIEHDGNRTRFASTDGHRLALLDYHGVLDPWPTIPPKTFVIPTQSAKVLYQMSRVKGFKMTYEGMGVLTLTTDEDAICIQAKDLGFPDYERVIPPGEDVTTLTFNKSYLADVPGDELQMEIEREVPENYEGTIPAVFRVPNGLFVVMPIDVTQIFGLMP